MHACTNGTDGAYAARAHGALHNTHTCNTPTPTHTPEPQVLDVLPLADTVTKLAARCQHCGAPAHFSLRVSADDRLEVVGGADTYLPVCRSHYASLSHVRGGGGGGGDDA